MASSTNANLFEVALNCVAHGWHIFPCRPKSKEPAVAGGFKAATRDEAQVRAWWMRWPDANVGIATAPSGLCVLDCDHGLDGIQGLKAFRAAKGLQETYTVRTGRRDSFGVQMYFAGADVRSTSWVDGALSGDIRCSSGYVMAAGSVHPSGELYSIITDAPLAAVPAYVRTLKPRHGAGLADDGGLITEARNNTLTSIAGKLRNAVSSAEALETALLIENANRCVPPLDDDEVRRIAANAMRWNGPQDAPVATIGVRVRGFHLESLSASCPQIGAITSTPVAKWRTLQMCNSSSRASLKRTA